jgi:drug/metabolite transporter (DMT)-like permease
MALIVGLQPILTAFAAAPLLGERVTRVQWLGFVLGFSGVVLVVWEKFSLDRLNTASVAWAIVSLLSITFGTLYQKRFCPRFDIRSGSIIQFGAALLLVAPLAFLMETRQVNWTGEFMFALAWLVLVLSLGAISLLFYLIEHGEATRVSSLFYLTPLVTALMAYAMFGETLSALAMAGMLLGIAGVALVVRRLGRPE